jgi:hypothetical protein
MNAARATCSGGLPPPLRGRVGVGGSLKHRHLTIPPSLALPLKGGGDAPEFVARLDA